MEKLAPGVLAAVIGLGALTACHKDRAPRPDAAPRVRPGGLATGQPRLVQAVRSAIEGCQLSEMGTLDRCPDGADDQLEAEEGAVGGKQATLTYCHGLADADRRVRILSAARLNRLAYHRSMAQWAKPALLDCLLGALRVLTDPQLARPVARAAAAMAPVLRREAELLRLIDRRKAAVQEAVYAGLWANGRLRVLDALARVVRDAKRPVRVRVAAIEGFAGGDRLRESEAFKVCGLLGPLLADPSPQVAAAAARAAGDACPALADRVLDAVEALVRGGRLEPDHVAAVRAVDTPERRKRVLALLTTVLNDGRLPESTRAAALSKIRWIDRALGMRLAKKHLRADAGALRIAAEAILGAGGDRRR